jgi:type IV secretory pathway VirB10-like protein
MSTRLLVCFSRCGTEAASGAFVRILEITDMSSKAHIFFAGVGTTCVIVAVGFGSGLIITKPTLKEPTGYQARANTESIMPVRIILPASAEAAQAPQPSAVAVATPEPQPQVQPSVKEVQAPVEKQVEKADTRKAEAEARDRRRRYADRRARKIAAARARQQQEPQMGERSEPGPMAYDGDRPRYGGGLFGN